MAWLARAAQAARKLDYVGTIVYQIGPRVESSRITHLNDDGREYAKLVNLDGPAREVVRSQGEVRCYYPDAKLVRVEPRTFRNVFPSLSSEQQQSLSRYYAVSRRRRRSRRRPARCRSSCSSRRTDCATGTDSGPTAPPACC